MVEEKTNRTNILCSVVQSELVITVLFFPNNVLFELSLNIYQLICGTTYVRELSYKLGYYKI